MIRAGDRVWSRDEATGAWGYNPVTETFVTHPDAVYRVAYDPDGAAGPLPAATLGTTAPHPFYVASRDGDGDGRPGGFVPAGELIVGDALVLADGSSAWVTGLEVERAAGGEAFTTHNFAVADYHTYFVGEGGVWVHNVGKGLCERMLSLYKQIVDTRGLQEKPWEAFKILLQKTSSMSSRVDAALPDTAFEVMQQAYKVATTNGVNRTGIPSVKQIYEAVGSTWTPALNRWIGGRLSPGALNNHHTVVQAWARRIGVPETRMDDMPGMLLEQLYHVGDNAIPDAPAFHRVFDAVVAEFKSQGKNLNDKSVILELHNIAYTRWNADIGPKVWAVARGWLRDEGFVP